LGYPIQAIHVPKTVDNDLPITDCCPGFGSVAKYVAVSIREAGFDVASMAKTSTKVFIMEVMGRHAGWIAAAGGLAAEKEGDAPHIILFPELALDEPKFLARVKECVEKYGYCAVSFPKASRMPTVNSLPMPVCAMRSVMRNWRRGTGDCAARQGQAGYKYHWAVADYLQRAARHIASQVDVEQAYAVGKMTVELALQGRNSVMPTIVRVSDKPYKWKIGVADLDKVANVEKMLPRDYITEDGFHITAKGASIWRP